MRRVSWKSMVVVGALAITCQSAGASAAGQRFFSVASRDGAWWFVDPTGSPFFSLGVNVVTPGLEQDRYDAASPQYASWRYYADDAAWADAATRRLRQWKFNTVGGWPHRLMQRGDLPYAEVLHIGAEEAVPWNDLFSAAFAEHMDRLIAERVVPRRDDPQLLGWFTDNELAWYPDTTLTFHADQPAESATRQRLIELLREHYKGDFEALSRDFAVSDGGDSFAALSRGGSLKLLPGGQSQSVVTEFAELVADRYYDVICTAIRKHDPHHLLLGDRYHGYCPDAVVNAAARHLDVISTNYDWPRGIDGYLPKFYLRRLHALTAKPVLVTEYYSAARDNRSGNPNSGGLFVVVDNQQSRAEVVRTRLQSFADEPFVVGAHWFSYADEPPLGRSGDGEDYNFGLVDINDDPYKEVTSTMRQMHLDAPRRHAASAAPEGDAPEKLRIDVRRLPQTAGLAHVDETLLSQTELAPTDDAGLADLIGAWDAERLYLTIAGNHCVMERAYSAPPQPASEGLTWTVTVARGGDAAEFQLDMLGQTAERREGTSEYVYWQRGVRFGATLAVTAKELGCDSFHAGETIRVNVALRDNRDGRRTRWSAELTCVDPGGPAIPTASRVTLESTDRTDR